MMNKVSKLMVAITLSLTAAIANAAVIDFAINAPTSGSINYVSAFGSTLTGTNIDVDTIVGLDTPTNPNAAITCDACLLNFTSGAVIGGWDFGSGGMITITGGVTAAGIAPGSTLLSGTFDSATVVDVGNNMFDFNIAGASFIDTKHPDLLAYFGMPSGDYNGGLNISFNMLGNPAVGDAFDSDALFSGDIVNSPVPVPAAVWLFGSGLIGLVGVARRRA